MAIPKRIPVSREGGNYSKFMGVYRSGRRRCQFWGQVVAAFADMPRPRPSDWGAYKRWYAVLHRFDARGKHLGTDHHFAGTTADSEEDVCERARAELDAMIAGLGPVEWADIAIGLFRVEIDGNTFGLVDVSEPDEGPEWADRVSMEPGDLLFTAPWNGNYDS